jgi:hypothetical protein
MYVPPYESAFGRWHVANVKNVAGLRVIFKEHEGFSKQLSEH